MTKSRKIKIISAVVGIAVAVGIGVSVTRKPKVAYETEVVGKGTVVREVSVTGSIAPSKKISLQPEVGGKVAKVAAVEGADVKAGDVLIELDTRDVAAKVASQRAAADSARARLAELVAGATPQELALAETALATASSKRDSAIAAKADAQTSLENAKTNYANVVAKAASLMSGKLDAFLLDYEKADADARDAVERLAGPMYTSSGLLTFSTLNASVEQEAVSTRTDAKARLTELTAAVAAIKAAGTAEAALNSYAVVAADLSSVKKHLEASREVLNYASGLSSATLSTYQTNVGAALSSINLVIQTLSADKSNVDLQQKLNASEVTSAQISVSNAQAALSSATYAVDTSEKALAQAKADLDLKKTGNRAEVIAAQRARVAAEDAALAGLVAELGKRTIVAPLDAVVTEVTTEPGESVQPSQVVVTLNAKGKFEIVSNVSEVDIASVAIGQPVSVTLDAFPTVEKWTGKVVTVNPAEKVVEGVIFYETKIVFDQEDPRLKSGMTANLDIETGRRENALRVPLRAIRTKPGRSYVELLVSGAPQERGVKIGIENSQYAEVLEGLSEGETVIVATSEKK